MTEAFFSRKKYFKKRGYFNKTLQKAVDKKGFNDYDLDEKNISA